MSKKLRCFLKKITQLTKILHDRRSRRSRQISSLLVLYVFFSTSFSYVFFFIPSPSLLLHLFLFLCLLPPPFPVLYTLYFLDVFVNVPLSFQVFLPSQSPSHLCLWIFLLSFSLSLSSPVSSDLLYHPIVRGWILSRFTLYLSRKSSLFLFLYRLNHKFREPFAIHICNNNKVFFQILNSLISSSNLALLLFFVKVYKTIKNIKNKGLGVPF